MKTISEIQRQYCKGVLKVFAVLVASICVVASFVPPNLFARERPKRHFLSWELTRRPERYKRFYKRHMSLRRFKVSRDRVAGLKKSSFWNKRPYQFAIPIVENEVLFVGVDAAHFYAVDVKHGKKLWEFHPEGPVHAGAAYADGIVYFGDAKANLYAVDASTGEERWHSSLGTEILATPLILGPRLYITDMSGRLYLLDRSNGAQIWHTDPLERPIGFSVRRASAPTAAGGMILVGTPAGQLVAYRQENGGIAWVRQLGDRLAQVYDVDSQPLVVGDRVYAASADGGLHCLDYRTGDILWSAEAGGANNILYSNEHIYASGGGVLSAVDPSTGNIFWQQDLETPSISTPVAGLHFIAVVSTVDKLYLIDSDTGDIVYDRFIRKGSFSDPVIVDGRLYLLANTGRLYSFEIREKPKRHDKGGSSKVKGER